MPRLHYKQIATLQDRIAEWATGIREQAEKTRPGPERDQLLTKLHNAETAMHLDEWANSPGLQSQPDSIDARISRLFPK